MKNRNLLFTSTTLVVTLMLAACQGSAASNVVPTNPPAVAAVPTNVPPTSPPVTVAPTSEPPTSAPATVEAATVEPDGATSVNVAAGAPPVFSKPLEITNPYYPVSPISQTISIGTEDGKSARVEVTLLPDTKTISWAGGTTQVRISQFVDYSADQLVEIANDYFAQADNGDVYYFGEDVANYEDGQVNDHEGTLAGGKGRRAACADHAGPSSGRHDVQPGKSTGRRV